MKKASSELSFNSKQKRVCEEKNPESENSDETEFQWNKERRTGIYMKKTKQDLLSIPETTNPETQKAISIEA